MGERVHPFDCAQCVQLVGKGSAHDATMFEAQSDAQDEAQGDASDEPPPLTSRDEVRAGRGGFSCGAEPWGER